MRKFLSNLSRNAWKCWATDTYIKICACALVKYTNCCRGVTLCIKLWSYQLLQCVCESRTEFHFVQCIAYQKTLRNRPRYTSQVFSNLYCHAMAVTRQFSGKTAHAQCNSTFTLVCVSKSSKCIRSAGSCNSPFPNYAPLLTNKGIKSRPNANFWYIYCNF